MSTPPRALFTGLVDDAAMFPPGNASPAEAITEHLRYRSSWFADLVGPLLVPAHDVRSFAAAHAAGGSPHLAVVLIGATTTSPADLPVGVTLVGFEAPVDDVPLPTVRGERSFAAEIRSGESGDRVLRAVAEQRAAGRLVMGKFRAGGATAAAFPTERQLAHVIRQAADLGVPLKLTAGLHHAVRYTDLHTGFEHHGFLNVIVAISRSLASAGSTEVEQALGSRDAESLVAEVGELDDREVRAVRERFVSFGCCGVEDPVTDLVDLAMIRPAPKETR